MKAKIIFSIIITGIITLCAWTKKQNNDIKKAEWLIGTWENKSPRRTVYETWSKTSDIEFTGKSYILKEADTIVFENLRLVQEQNKLIYIPTVKNQNDGLPVRFTSKTITETELVFENLQHDFPQIISYTKIGADSLVAVISGTKNGQERKQTFPMKRLN